MNEYNEQYNKKFKNLKKLQKEQYNIKFNFLTANIIIIF